MKADKISLSGCSAFLAFNSARFYFGKFQWVLFLNFKKFNNFGKYFRFNFDELRFYSGKKIYFEYLVAFKNVTLWLLRRSTNFVCRKF